MSQMDIDRDMPTVLATLRMEADPELTAQFYTMEDLWERKLWHQLTDVLNEIYADPRSEAVRLRLFSQFVATFEAKINQLSLVRLGLAAASQSANSAEAVSFVAGLVVKVDKPESTNAHVYAQIELARLKLGLQDVEGAKKLLDEAAPVVDALVTDSLIINASFYGVSAEYYKQRADFTSYYRNALLYLACIDLAELSPLEQQQKAHDLAVAALLGDKIYNFGELLLHPILDTLKSTEYQWLVDVLFALNAGDIKAFEGLSGHLAKQPLLQSSQAFLRQKICLTALTEAVFQRPTSSRTLTFATISQETHLVKDEVEHLVMKALSLGLLKGFIDQVSETVIITWVQPRVMNKTQIESMRQRLVKWDSDVKKLGEWIEGAGKDIWTAA